MNKIIAIQALETGTLKLDGGAMFGVVPKSIWNRLNPADENNLCTWAMRCLAVETDDGLLVIDSGMGYKQSEKFFSYYQPEGNGIIDALQKKGYDAKDVRHHWLTHLHFDHCGGSIMRGNQDILEPVFPNAQYYCHIKHWDTAANPNPREKASFLSENIQPMNADGRLVFLQEGMDLGNITFRISNGHTEAMTIPMIPWRGTYLCFVADLFPSMHHIPPHFNMGYDVRPLDIMNEKRNFLEEAVKNNWVMFFEHDPKYMCCTVRATEKGFAPEHVFTLEEW